VFDAHADSRFCPDRADYISGGTIGGPRHGLSVSSASSRAAEALSWRSEQEPRKTESRSGVAVVRDSGLSLHQPAALRGLRRSLPCSLGVAASRSSAHADSAGHLQRSMLLLRASGHANRKLCSHDDESCRRQCTYRIAAARPNAASFHLSTASHDSLLVARWLRRTRTDKPNSSGEAMRSSERIYPCFSCCLFTGRRRPKNLPFNRNTPMMTIQE